MVTFQWWCVMATLLLVVGLGQELHQSEFQGSRLRQLQEDLATPTPFNLSSATPMSSNSSFLSIVSDYWYVCLVVVVLVVVCVVFLCASVLRKKRRQDRVQISQSQLQSIEGDGAPCEPSIRGNSSPGLLHSAGGSPGNLSIGQSPIPSPQPSFSSSHKSMRSSGRGSARRKRRNHSPGHTSSGSEDTIRPYQCYSMSSLASSVSTIGPHNARLHRTESFGSGRGSERGYGSERRGSEGMEESHFKPAPPHQVKVVSGESPLHSAPSTLSITSTHSRPSRHRATPTPGLIQVDVKVHLEQENTAPFQIAAALAESARQLAQSAANFEQEDGLAGGPPSSLHHSRSSLSSSRPSIPTPSSHHHHHTPSRRKLFTNHSSSALLQPHPLPLLSLDRPGHTLSLDKPRPTATPLSHSLSKTGPGRRGGGGGGGREWARRNSTSSYSTVKSDSILPTAPAHRHHLLQQGGKLALHQDDSAPSHDLAARHLPQSVPAGSKDSTPMPQAVDSHNEAVGQTLVEDTGSPSTSHQPPPQCGEEEREPFPLTGQQDTEMPSPHSSSQPSLSRSGSPLSLDPQLSSTASGYAATGSSSSLDTLTKPTPPAPGQSPQQDSKDGPPQDTHMVQGKDGVTLVSPSALSAHPPPPHRPGYPLVTPSAAYPLPPFTTYHTGDHVIYNQDHMTNPPILQSAGFRQRNPPDHTHNYTYRLPSVPPSGHPSDSITIDV